MILVCLGAVVLPDSGLLAVGIPLVLPICTPAVKTGFVHPLVGTAAQHQGVLLPDAAAGQVEACLLEGLTEVQPLRVRMEHIDAAVRCQVLIHLGVSRQQEAVELAVAHVVVHDLASSFFHVYVVRRVRQHQIGLLAVHQLLIGFGLGGIPAEHTMLAKEPQVTLLGEHRLLQLGIHIEVILLDFLAVNLVEQRLDLRRVKTCKAQVKAAVLDVLQQIRQEGIVPCAGDLVERDVQRLLTSLIDIHHGTRHFGVAKAHGHGQTLMATDDGHICVDHQRISKTKLLNGVLDLLVLLIPRLQFLPGIIFCRFEYRYRQHLQFRSFLHSLPP